MKPAKWIFGLVLAVFLGCGARCAVCGERGGGAPQTKSPSLNGLYFFTSPRLPWEKGTGMRLFLTNLPPSRETLDQFFSFVFLLGC